MILGTVVLFFGYGLRESSRQDEAQIQQRNTSIGRGIDTYTTLCFSCHGESGQGAVVPGVTPERVAPPLNRPDLRPTDPDQYAKTYDSLFKTIQRGRPGTPMPAWGQTDGGALQDEQINELVLMIMNGATPIPYDNVTATPWTHTATWSSRSSRRAPSRHCRSSRRSRTSPSTRRSTRSSSRASRSSCSSAVAAATPSRTFRARRARSGRTRAPMVTSRSSASARRIAGGAVPNNNQDDLAKWIENPSALKPGTAMPTLGLSQDQAEAAAAYLYSLQ